MTRDNLPKSPDPASSPQQREQPKLTPFPNVDEQLDELAQIVLKMNESSSRATSPETRAPAAPQQSLEKTQAAAAPPPPQKPPEQSLSPSSPNADAKKEALSDFHPGAFNTDSLKRLEKELEQIDNGLASNTSASFQPIPKITPKQNITQKPEPPSMPGLLEENRRKAIKAAMRPHQSSAQGAQQRAPEAPSNSSAPLPLRAGMQNEWSGLLKETPFSEKQESVSPSVAPKIRFSPRTGFIVALASTAAVFYYYFSPPEEVENTGSIPPLILADSESYKEKPENAGEISFPNIDKKVLEPEKNKNSQTFETVSTEEPPLDLDKILDAETPQALEPSADASSQRKPQAKSQPLSNGVFVAEPQDAAQTTAAPLSSSTSQTSLLQEQGVTFIRSFPITLTKPDVAPPPTAETTAPANTQQPSYSKASSSPTPPVAVTREKVSSLFQPLKASRNKDALVTGSTSSISAAPPRGSFSVQLAAPNSRDDALRFLQSFRRKYANFVKNKPLFVQPFEKGGRTFFRVRLGYFNRAEASSLCATLKENNLSCFVAIND